MRETYANRHEVEKTKNNDAGALMRKACCELSNGVSLSNGVAKMSGHVQNVQIDFAPVTTDVKVPTTLSSMLLLGAGDQAHLVSPTTKFPTSLRAPLSEPAAHSAR